ACKGSFLRTSIVKSALNDGSYRPSLLTWCFLNLGVCLPLSRSILWPLLLVTIAGCAAADPAPPPASFADYQAKTRQMVAERRSFQSDDHAAEIRYNTPQEWRPDEQSPSPGAQRGILLAHGLGDSPFSFSDIGPALARQGFLVRTVLLPGHGTDPADL